MNVELAPLSEIETALNNFDFIETNNPVKPIMGRIIIGNILENENLKMIVLEIGLESSDNAEDYGWYWEIKLSDDSSTEIVSKKHDVGFSTSYKPSCKACSIIPMELRGDKLKDFSKLIIEDIKENFDIKN
ncbi:hypothetical protein [Methanobacterium oryzae]|uniref:hypothetical protein n=1 Tax=Methanobacterium oryzae TaxID=69540 RepID=UPI003D2419DB